MIDQMAQPENWDKLLRWRVRLHLFSTDSMMYALQGTVALVWSGATASIHLFVYVASLNRFPAKAVSIRTPVSLLQSGPFFDLRASMPFSEAFVLTEVLGHVSDFGDRYATQIMVQAPPISARRHPLRCALVIAVSAAVSSRCGSAG
ncbi:hypothetical protein [Roseobacter litoralis]|uniref:hypothetical protein n=1 Tax=Roseobacter litoralis TaxID=42443 RepID=UPI0024958944|nr:hypothetical protein [Roseobacter litoralis]